MTRLNRLALMSPDGTRTSPKRPADEASPSLLLRTEDPVPQTRSPLIHKRPRLLFDVPPTDPARSPAGAKVLSHDSVTLAIQSDDDDISSGSPLALSLPTPTASSPVDAVHSDIPPSAAAAAAAENEHQIPQLPAMIRPNDALIDSSPSPSTRSVHLRLVELPEEFLELVVESLDVSSLLAFCTSSRLLCVLIRPVLYRSVDISRALDLSNASTLVLQRRVALMQKHTRKLIISSALPTAGQSLNVILRRISGIRPESILFDLAASDLVLGVLNAVGSRGRLGIRTLFIRTATPVDTSDQCGEPSSTQSVESLREVLAEVPNVINFTFVSGIPMSIEQLHSLFEGLDISPRTLRFPSNLASLTAADASALASMWSSRADIVSLGSNELDTVSGNSPALDVLLSLCKQTSRRRGPLRSLTLNLSGEQLAVEHVQRSLARVSHSLERLATYPSAGVVSSFAIGTSQPSTALGSAMLVRLIESRSWPALHTLDIPDIRLLSTSDFFTAAGTAMPALQNLRAQCILSDTVLANVVSSFPRLSRLELCLRQCSLRMFYVSHDRLMFARHHERLSSVYVEFRLASVLTSRSESAECSPSAFALMFSEMQRDSTAALLSVMPLLTVDSISVNIAFEPTV